MPNTKISALASGTPALAGDFIPIARAGANYYLTPAMILSYGSSTITGTTITATTSFVAGSSADAYLTRYATKQLMISGDGTGGAGNRGWILGHDSGSTLPMIWPTNSTPSSSNYALLATDSTVQLNGVSTLYLNVNNVNKVGLTATAGEGPAITAGTATTDVNALSITQTWNAAVLFSGIKLNVTNTSSTASSKLIQLQSGSADMLALRLAASNTPYLRIGNNSGTSSGGGIEVMNSAGTRTIAMGVDLTGGFGVGSANVIGFGSTTDPGAGLDTVLTRYAAKQLMISGDGTGATTNAGFVLGYSGDSGYASLWSTVSTKGATDYIIYAGATDTYINAGSSLNLRAGNNQKISIGSTAGVGPSISAGTATTDVNALSIAQTWNGGAVAFKAKRTVITNTTSAAGSLVESWELSTGQGIGIQNLSELTTIAAAATTDTTIQIPANVIVLGVSVRVTTVIPTAATFTVIGTTSSTAFQTGANVSTVATTTDVGTKSCPYLNATAQTVRITPNAQPADNSGRVRVTVHYQQITAPTS